MQSKLYGNEWEIYFCKKYIDKYVLKEDIDSRNLKISSELSQLSTVEADMHFQNEKAFYWKVLKICLIHHNNTKVWIVSYD